MAISLQKRSCGPHQVTETFLTGTSENDTEQSVTMMQQLKQHHQLFLLSVSAATELPNFQYKGQDLSLTYKYVLSPIAEWCVQNVTPRYIAPNVITLTGLVFMFIGYLATWFYAPLILGSMDTVPRWVFLLNAVSILIYQTLDNMDGKQARRVGASSPLGLFFDHGCDAVNSVFGSTNWIVALALSPNETIHCFIMLMGPYALFYFSTWEEYYTGELIMPIVNGPNEGLLGAVFVNLVSFWCGPAYWQSNSWWESTFGRLLETTSEVSTGQIRNADVLIFVSGICMLQEVWLKTIAIVRKFGLYALLDLLPLLVLATCTVVVGFTNYNIWTDIPRTSIHLSSILFVDMTTDLMLRHMTKQKYRPYRLLMLPLLIFTVAVATKSWPHDFLSTGHFLIVYTASAGSFLIFKTVILVHEMCLVLNIRCFSLGKLRIKDRSLISNGHQSKID
jgi:ethanolaminephosphotransferase